MGPARKKRRGRQKPTQTLKGGYDQDDPEPEGFCRYTHTLSFNMGDRPLLAMKAGKSEPDGVTKHNLRDRDIKVFRIRDGLSVNGYDPVANMENVISPIIVAGRMPSDQSASLDVSHYNVVFVLATWKPQSIVP